MSKNSFTSLVGVLLVGTCVSWGLPAHAQQVQVSYASGGQSPDSSAPPPSTPPSTPPAEQVQINNAAPPAAAAPLTINTVQVGERSAYTRRLSTRLMISGATMFGVLYFSTVLGAAIASDVCNADSALGCREANWPIYLPIVGPFVQMGYINGTGAATGRTFLALDGVLQAGGVAMFIAGAALWRSDSPAITRVAKRFQLAPYTANAGGGLLAFGRF